MMMMVIVIFVIQVLKDHVDLQFIKVKCIKLIFIVMMMMMITIIIFLAEEEIKVKLLC